MELDRASLALKLTPSAQSQTLQDPTLIPSLLDRAIPGAGENISVETLIPASLNETLVALVARAKARSPNYEPPDFKAWYRIKVATDAAGNPVLVGAGGGQGDQPDLTLVDRLVTSFNDPARFPEIESTHALRVQAPPAVKHGQNPLAASQGYLDPAPRGIDANAAWTAGADGTGVVYVDVEPSWELGHEDLRVVGGPGAGVAKVTLLGPGINVGPPFDHWADFKDHGTGVLGILSMSDNRIGGVGVCPAAQGHVIGECQVSVPGRTVGSARAAAVLAAAGATPPPDVLVLQMQSGLDDATGMQNWPVEIERDVFDQIKLATNAGVVVIEPAGNGDGNVGQDLDGYDGGHGRVLNPADAAFTDSGAIMVGACGAAVPHFKTDPTSAFGNFGGRVDLFAWGQHVTTARFGGVTPYTADFGGTSAASAIVAGAAILLQGLALAGKCFRAPAGGRRTFSPAEVRDILKIGGTPSAGGPADRVGVMPNLARLVANVTAGGIA